MRPHEEEPKLADDSTIESNEVKRRSVKMPGLIKFNMHSSRAHGSLNHPTRAVVDLRWRNKERTPVPAIVLRSIKMQAGNHARKGDPSKRRSP